MREDTGEAPKLAEVDRGYMVAEFLSVAFKLNVNIAMAFSFYWSA